MNFRKIISKHSLTVFVCVSLIVYVFVIDCLLMYLYEGLCLSVANCLFIYLFWAPMSLFVITSLLPGTATSLTLN